MKLIRQLLPCLALCAGAAAAAPPKAAMSDWITPAERSQFRTTPSYADTHAYLERLAAAAPQTIRLTRFGVSPEGRDLMLVVAAKGGEFTPEAARASGKDIVLVQAGIHAGEIEGKDAALMLLRDLSVAGRHAKLLDHAILVWLPIFNVDGHENSTPYNRINQNGPDEMGFRATAQNLNLNRDYTKADAPEMRDWLAMFAAWQPDLFMDIHTTDGADYQYDLTWYMESWGPLHPAVKAWEDHAFKQSIFPAFDRMGHLQAPYLDLVDHRDITKGVGNFGSGPRFSTGYVALRNRAALLVETHMLKPYAVRVKATYDLVVAVLDYINAHPGELRKATAQADADTIAHANDRVEIPVAFKTTDQPITMTLKGYAFTQQKSDISGDTWVTYDPKTPRTYEIPFYRDLIATASVRLPAAYIVPPGWPEVVDKLAQHGIRFERLAEASSLDVERYRLTKPVWDAKPFEGRHVIGEVAIAAEHAKVGIPAGSVLVPMDQPAANVVANLLEPAAPDSLLRWGFLDTVFEQKEYADARVAERLARDAIAKDPALKAEFDAKVAADPEFAKSPSARLAFFYERSPWFTTQQVGAYPVLRLDAAALGKLRPAR
ncbi:MAG TPA: M14 family metallopeptidase [Rhodanobacteraceae bacterium]|nr:M14 family metallopeptidase [Rhodanobacteraceae bacterium]